MQKIITMQWIFAEKFIFVENLEFVPKMSPPEQGIKKIYLDTRFINSFYFKIKFHIPSAKPQKILLINCIFKELYHSKNLLMHLSQKNVPSRTKFFSVGHYIWCNFDLIVNKPGGFLLFCSTISCLLFIFLK